MAVGIRRADHVAPCIRKKIGTNFVISEVILILKNLTPICIKFKLLAITALKVPEGIGHLAVTSSEACSEYTNASRKYGNLSSAVACVCVCVCIKLRITSIVTSR
jgi:hypothetical protein